MASDIDTNLLREKRGFWKWFRQENLKWARWPHPSRSDYFGVVGFILMFPATIGIAVFLVVHYSVGFLLSIPTFVLGYLSVQYAIYLEEQN